MKRTGLVCLLAIMTVLAACDSGPALRVTDIQVIAPAPGRTASVAYLKLSNNSGDAVALTAISSPQFGRVEMHETVISDGVARMQALHSISIEAGTFHALPGYLSRYAAAIVHGPPNTRRETRSGRTAGHTINKCRP